MEGSLERSRAVREDGKWTTRPRRPSGLATGKQPALGQTQPDDMFFDSHNVSEKDRQLSHPDGDDGAGACEHRCN